MDSILDALSHLVNLLDKILDYSLFSEKSIVISLRRILWASLCVLLVYAIIGLLGKIFSKRIKNIEDKSAFRRFNSLWNFIKYLTFIFTFLFSLRFFGIDFTALLIGSSVLFIGLGFGMQHFFMDFISGITILIDRSVKVDDVIKIDGLVGMVKSISLRTTTIDTRDDRVVVIPNHKFLSNNLYNWTRHNCDTRFHVKVGIAYGSDTKLVRDLLLAVVENHSLILKNPHPHVLFGDFGDSALIFELYFYTNVPFREPVIKSDLRFMIDKEFRKAGIEIPFPQRDVHTYPTKNK